MSRQRIPFVVVAMLLSMPVAVFGQRTNTTLSGNITDPSNAPVPEAAVTATEVSTGVTTKATSDSTGFYIITNLAPGTYTVAVEKTGFEKYLQKGVVIQVDRPVTVNATLTVGQMTQAVTVSGRSNQVNTRSQTLSYDVTTQMAVDLPLNGREVLQLQTVAPDMGPTYGGTYQQLDDRPEDSSLYYSADGGTGNTTGFYLDGALNEDSMQWIANIYPNPDAIQEFSVETNDYATKFAGQGGAVVNAVTKGGTNQFHGDLFEFVRYFSMNARNFFSSTQDGLKRNQFGGTIGGPIQKDKTFFFFSYQGTRLRSLPSENSATDETTAELNGNWSAISKQLVNPSTGLPFPGNQVPVTDYDLIALKMLSYFPVGAANTGLLFYTTESIQNDNQYVSRVDHSFGSKFRLYGSYLYDALDYPSTAVLENALTWGNGPEYWESQNGAVNGTWTVRPNLLANFVIGVSRRYDQEPAPSFVPDWKELGVNAPDVSEGGAGHSIELAITNYSTTLGIRSNGTVPCTLGDASTNWTWIRSSHTVDFGAEFIDSKCLRSADIAAGGDFTMSSALSGNNLLDFLLDTPSSFSQGEAYYYVGQMSWLPSLYLDDTWKVTRKLSISAGLRWNPFKPIVDTAYHSNWLFSYAWYNQGLHSTRYPNLPPGLLVDGDPGVPHGAIQDYYSLFNPRLGLAYDPFGNGKTSIRAGYGLYPQDLERENFPDQAGSPFSVSVSFPFPAGALENPYQGQVDPFPVPRPTPSNATFQSPLGGLTPITPGLVPPYVQQWNVSVERQLPAATLLRVAYEGSNSWHAWTSFQGNPSIYNPAQTQAQNLADEQSRRPLPQYQGLQLYSAQGTYNYNALVISAEKRLTKGLSFVGGYRFSKCLDEIEQAYTQFSDPYNTRFDYGPCSYNDPNQFRFSYTWQLPVVSSLGFVGRNVLGGWETTGILSLQSGMPFNVTTGADYSLTGIGEDRPDLIGNPRLPGGRSEAQEIQEWFNTSAFTTNTLGTFGDISRDFLSGPGFANLDFALMKSIPIKKGPFAESQHIDFRGEFFNLTNRVNFGEPTSSLSSSIFGRITGANTPRIVQLSLKYIF